MRTVEEFAKIVKEENDKHNEELLSLNPATLIGRAWEISKWQAIYDYIMERIIPYYEYGEDMLDGFLTLEIDEPISAIYDFEFDYDEPMWTTWDGLDIVVLDMIKEMKKQKN